MDRNKLIIQETDCKNVSPETMEIRLVAISGIENMKKFIMSLRTAQVNEYSLDKEHSSYDDLLGTLTLYSIKTMWALV